MPTTDFVAPASPRTVASFSSDRRRVAVDMPGKKTRFELTLAAMTLCRSPMTAPRTNGPASIKKSRQAANATADCRSAMPWKQQVTHDRLDLASNAVQQARDQRRPVSRLEQRHSGGVPRFEVDVPERFVAGVSISAGVDRLSHLSSLAVKSHMPDPSQCHRATA